MGLLLWLHNFWSFNHVPVYTDFWYWSISALDVFFFFSGVDDVLHLCFHKYLMFLHDWLKVLALLCQVPEAQLAEPYKKMGAAAQKRFDLKKKTHTAALWMLHQVLIFNTFDILPILLIRKMSNLSLWLGICFRLLLCVHPKAAHRQLSLIKTVDKHWTLPCPPYAVNYRIIHLRLWKKDRRLTNPLAKGWSVCVLIHLYCSSWNWLACI